MQVQIKTLVVKIFVETFEETIYVKKMQLLDYN